MSHNQNKTNHILIPALLASAAAYFGFSGKSEQLADVTKQIVAKAIDHQAQKNNNSKKPKRFRFSRRSRKKLRYNA